MPLSIENQTALIIDDEADICLLLKLFLHKKGIASSCAYNLTEGFYKALEMKPDWLFLDNNLPDGEGIQRVKELRLVSPSSKIIMISAFDNLRGPASAAGIHVFIEKPLSFSEVERAMGQCEEIN